jgi:hypothetical protein
MVNGEWVEIQKKFEYSGKGELIPKEVVMELRVREAKPWVTKYKDHLDIFFKIFGLFAIAVPVWLFLGQQKAEARKQKALLQLNTYTEVSTQIFKWIGQNPISEKSDSTRDFITNEYYSKIQLLGDTTVIRKFKYIISNFNLYKVYACVANLASAGFELNKTLGGGHMLKVTDTINNFHRLLKFSRLSDQWSVFDSSYEIVKRRLYDYNFGLDPLPKDSNFYRLERKFHSLEKDYSTGIIDLDSVQFNAKIHKFISSFNNFTHDLSFAYQYDLDFDMQMRILAKSLDSSMMTSSTILYNK